jgi:3-hydroxy-3-methylglutaryl CoA synthase
VGGRQGRRPFLPPQVDQADLEAYDGAPPGKYTAGLGQKGIAFCDDSEDAVSMALTAVDRLLRSARVPVTDIGALHVGTESSPDRAKAVKTGLMQGQWSVTHYRLYSADDVLRQIVIRSHGA